jgi:alpha-tubulin suppressor-like RCC1 family protein
MSTKLCAQERAHCGTHGTAAVASTISAGTYHTCAVTTSGGLMCWGSNIQGQLGIGGDTPYQHSPTAVDLGSGLLEIQRIQIFKSAFLFSYIVLNCVQTHARTNAQTLEHNALRTYMKTQT